MADLSPRQTKERLPGTPNLRELYQEVILEHSREPRNFRELGKGCNHAEGYNPLCGDHFTVYLRMENDAVAEAAFQGTGCAIATASASMMTQAVRGKSREEAKKLFENFHRLVTEGGNADELGKLAVFSGVSEFPVRVKCATLAWHTLQAALDGRQEPVSTE